MFLQPYVTEEKKETQTGQNLERSQSWQAAWFEPQSVSLMLFPWHISLSGEERILLKYREGIPITKPQPNLQIIEALADSLTVISGESLS